MCSQPDAATPRHRRRRRRSRDRPQTTVLRIVFDHEDQRVVPRTGCAPPSRHSGRKPNRCPPFVHPRAGAIRRAPTSPKWSRGARSTPGTRISEYREQAAKLTGEASLGDHRPLFGGPLTMILAGRELAAASVAIWPAPFRGVLPLPFSALRTASVALRNPALQPGNPAHLRAVPRQLRDAVGEDAVACYCGGRLTGSQVRTAVQPRWSRWRWCDPECRGSGWSLVTDELQRWSLRSDPALDASGLYSTSR